MTNDDISNVVNHLSQLTERFESLLNKHEALYETRTPTSALLFKAAGTIHALMSGRGVDRKNGHDWDGFICELLDRAAAFKAVEDEEFK